MSLPLSICRHTAAVLGLVLVALTGTAQPLRAALRPRAMVASEHELASVAGVQILKEGGNAVDAAVATAFAVCVLNPSSCGIGGGGFMVIHLAKDKRTLALDYRETAPAAATRDLFVRDGAAVPELSLRSGLAVGVPGEVAGLSAALARHGSLPLPRVLAAAIRYAEEGFPVGAHLAGQIAQHREALEARPALARHFLHADRSPLQKGEKLRQPELARTLRQIATDGQIPFYEGDIAADIVRSVREAGGILSAEDLAGYSPRWRTPLHGRFRGFDVFTMPPPSSAGILLQILGMVEKDDLTVLGHNSPTYAHLLAEAMKHAFADRARFYGDADFVEVPLERLLAPQNVIALRRRISAVHAQPIDAYGTAPAPEVPARDAGTSHLAVIDHEGNAVSCTTTVNTAFGSMVVAAESGIILNNEMDDFSAQPGVPNVFGLVGAEANAVAAGKRPLSSMSPTIVARDGRAVLAVGGSGGPLILSGTLQVLLNALVFDMSAEDAVAAPRLHAQWLPAVVATETDLPEPTVRGLRQRGNEVRSMPPRGAVQMVRRRPGGLEGAADPRKGGGAVGW